MQCPKCNYEPTLSEVQRSPDDCVKCGINYAGFSAAKQERSQILDTARKEFERKSPEVRVALNQYPGAQPVVIIDFNMTFFSMVRFMVKWALASIPALVILIFTGAMVLGIVGGFSRHL